MLVGAITPCGQCRALPVRTPVAVRSRRRLRGHRRLAVRQHHQWCTGRVPAGPLRPGESREDPRRTSPTSRSCCWPTSRRPGFSGAESGGVRIGDAVVVFAQGPIGLCATAGRQAHGRGARHRRRRATTRRLTMARRMGADVVLDYRDRRRRRRGQAADGWRRRRGHRGARHAADLRDAPAVPSARRNAVEPRRLLGQAPGSVRCVRGRPWRPSDRHDAVPRRQGADAPADGMVQSGRFDPTPLLTHRFPLTEIGEGYRLFGDRLDGVLKVAITF